MSIKAIFRRVRSLHIQLLLALLIICILPITIVTLHALKIYQEKAEQEKYDRVIAICEDYASRIQKTGYLAIQTAELTAALTTTADMLEGRAIVVNSELLVLKDSFGREEGKTLISEEVILALRGKNSVYRKQTDQMVEIITPIREAQGEKALGALVFNYSMDPEYSMMMDVSRNIILFNMMILVFFFLLSLMISGQMTLPLKKLLNALRRYADGDREKEIVVTGNYEVEEIADSLNAMLEEMKHTEQRSREFVSNVSHELKTPLTSMKVLADSLLMDPNAPAELYKEFFEDINHEIDRENRIITDLLSLVRLERKEGSMQIAQVSINELLEIIMRRLRPIAKQRDIEMIFESYRNVVAEVDELKMSLVFTNLIENAIKYNIDGGLVKVALNADHKYFYVRVEDTGVGIPEEARKFIFDRFYRVDKARSRETGGTGLGLAIAKSAVLMHKGSIKVAGELGKGTIFTVRVPLSFVPDYVEEEPQNGKKRKKD